MTYSLKIVGSNPNECTSLYIVAVCVPKKSVRAVGLQPVHFNVLLIINNDFIILLYNQISFDIFGRERGWGGEGVCNRELIVGEMAI